MSKISDYYLYHNVRSNHKKNKVYLKICPKCGYEWKSKGPNTGCPECKKGAKNV